MKLKSKRLLALSLALLMLGALLCSCRAGGDEIPENMQYATIAGSDYRLFLPVDWTLLTDTGVSGGYASLQNQAYIYVKVYDNPEGLGVQDYWTTTHAQAIANAFPASGGITHSDPNATTLGGLDAYFYTYEGTRDLVSYSGIETLCARNDKIYVLSFCARKDVYEGYLNAFDTVKTNFIFSDTPFEPKDPVNTVDPDAEAPDGMQLASNDDVAYRFYVPDNWILDKYLPTSSAYVSEMDRSNVGVTVYMPEVDQMTAEEYWAMCLEELSGVFSPMLFVTTPTTLDGRPANMYEYSGIIDGKTYCFAQTIAAYRGMVYTVTYTATEENYFTHRDTYLDILAAFDFRGN